jgi:transposase-like protein
MTTFNEPQHQTDEAARKWFEELRWPNGVVCPHCGSIGKAYARKKLGLYRCAEKECRKDFTVTTKSVMESSHIPLRLWAQAFTLICSSKKGISAHQVHRTLKITYKSAWFLCHRIREAMRSGGLAPMGSGGGIVEVDETFVGRLKGQPKRRTGWGHKNVVLTLVERDGGARSFHMAGVTVADVAPVVRANLSREARMMTDEATYYKEVASRLA